MTPEATPFDTVIVGAGIAGASLAWQLLQPDGAAPGDGPGDGPRDGPRAPRSAPPRVLLLEREAQPGYHSTGRSAAMFMESYGPPQVRALTRASRALYAQPPAGFLQPGEQVLSPRAALYLASPGQQTELDATHASLAPHCPGLRLLDAAQTLALAPCLRPEQVLGAVLDVGGADIDVHALHQGFLRGLRQAGGQLWCGAELLAAQRLTAPEAADAPEASDAATDALPWLLTLADGRQLRARRVVNAAGAWADAVGALLGAAPIGLVPRRRSAFTFDAPAGLAVADWPAVVGVDETWYFKPDAGRLLGSPANADPTVPHDVQPEELDIALGIHRIEAVSTLQIRRPSSTWAGLRSFVADGELVIGWDSAVPGLFWLAAQGGYGIQSAAGAAALAASLLRGQPLPAPLQAQGVQPALLAPARLQGAGRAASPAAADGGAGHGTSHRAEPGA